MSLMPACPTDGIVVSGYGRRRDPFTKRWRSHSGVDIASMKGTVIHSMWRGRVKQAGRSKGYGKFVVVRSGEFTVRYAHCNEVFVTTGDTVDIGEVIATVGETGRATGPHLHMEVRRNHRRVDPGMFVPGFCL